MKTKRVRVCVHNMTYIKKIRINNNHPFSSRAIRSSIPHDPRAEFCRLRDRLRRQNRPVRQSLAPL